MIIFLGTLFAKTEQILSAITSISHSYIIKEEINLSG